MTTFNFATNGALVIIAPEGFCSSSNTGILRTTDARVHWEEGPIRRPANFQVRHVQVLIAGEELRSSRGTLVLQ